MKTELPSKIVRIEVLKTIRGHRKSCTCERPSIELDKTNRLVYCTECGAIYDPFEALLYLAEHYDRIADDVNRLMEQRKQIISYKPHLVIIKRIEQLLGRGDNTMMPSCPYCKKYFSLEKLLYVSWGNKQFYGESDDLP